MNTHDMIELPEHDCLYEGTNAQGYIDLEPAYRKSTVLRLLEADRQRRGGSAFAWYDPTTGLFTRNNDDPDSGIPAGSCLWPLYREAPTLHNSDSGVPNAEPDYKQLFEQMCERCDALDAKLAEYSEREPVGYIMPTALKQLKAGGHAVVGGVSQGFDVPIYTAPQPADPVVRNERTTAEPVAYGIKATNTGEIVTVLYGRDVDQVGEYRADLVVPLYTTSQPAESCASLISDKPVCGSENGDCDSQPAGPVTCPICSEDEAHTGTCGSNDPNALCKALDIEGFCLHEAHREHKHKTGEDCTCPKYIRHPSCVQHEVRKYLPSKNPWGVAPQPAEPDVLPGEAVFGFAAWLTSLKVPVTFSECHGAAVGADLAAAYNASQGFDQVREDFHKRLKPYPKYEPSQPTEPVKVPRPHEFNTGNEKLDTLLDDTYYLIEDGGTDNAIKWHESLKEFLASVEPVKVPSDAEIGQILKEVLHNSRYGVHQWELWLEFASALFTRYGH